MEKTIKLSLEKARELYKKADPVLKELLEANFSKKGLYINIIDRIKTWKDILDELEEREEDVLPYNSPKNKQQISQNALAKIQKIAEVLNEGWEANWNNSNEYKYYPYFNNFSGGGGFWGSGCGVVFSSPGFKQHYKSRELSDYAGKQFLNIYREYLGI